MSLDDAGGRDLPGARRPGFPSRREVLEGIAGELAAAGLESPRVEAERLLSLALGISRADLQLSLSSELSPEHARPLAEAVRRRLAGEPLQHIEGTAEFRELELAADGRALVPRPETEQLIDLILVWTRERARATEGVRVVTRPGGHAHVAAALDIGTGSGAIALALVDERIAERVVALDRSGRALEQALENRSRVGFTEAVVEFRLVRGALWESVGEEERFDLIVSNPPYVSTAGMERLPREVRHDPHEALAGGAEGLDLIREILAGAWDHLKPGGALFVEIGEEQGDRVAALLTESGDWTGSAIRKDLAGRVRFAFAERGRRRS